jgi:hypothetical protein
LDTLGAEAHSTIPHRRTSRLADWCRPEAVAQRVGADVIVIGKLMHTMSVWMAVADWRQSIAGRPRMLEDGYAGRRRESLVV